MSAPRWWSCTAVVVLLVCGVAGATSAQDRELSWPDVSVTAHLDADGRLHVRERQVMLFTGDWNGGERIFTTRFGQSLTLDSIVRIDSATGTRHRLTEGDVDAVDHYDWGDGDGDRLRWRSRLPDDPPFDHKALIYELFFVYDNILKHDGGQNYTLNHDFAFADRAGAFDNFRLVLAIDSAWRPPADFDGRYSPGALPPGDGFVVHVPLTRVSSVAPQGVNGGAAQSVRGALLAILVSGVGVLLALLLIHDARLGRFASLPPRDAITSAWLDKEVYAFLPEVVGAAWDDSTSEAEVAATLARLVQEGKLASRVEEQKILFITRHILHLELKVSRDELVEHERKLVDALFGSTATKTDTDAVRARYKKTGFDPAGVIRATLKKKVDAMAPAPRKKKTRWSRVPTLLGIAVALVLFALAMKTRLSDGLFTLNVLAVSLPLYLIAMLVASDWRKRVLHIWPGAMIIVGLLVGMAVAFSRYVIDDSGYQPGALALASITVWLLALTNSICNRARLALTPERLALRQRLAAARRFFAAELSREVPDLTDASYPYLLAFGLGRHVDKWFKAFGGTNVTRMSSATPVVIGSSMHSSSGSSRAPFGGFGGGGGFSGGGGGASFSAAIGGMASSVPSPSSSGSSGGSSSSSSGGSSGGGGGGGW